MTTDQSIPYQQNMSSFDLAIVILEGRSNDYEDLEPLMPEANDTLRNAAPGAAYRIP